MNWQSCLFAFSHLRRLNRFSNEKKLETVESLSFRFQVRLNSVAAIKVSAGMTFFRGSKTFAESVGKLEFRSSKILFAFFPIKSTKNCDKSPTVGFELVILNSISAGNSNWWLAIRLNPIRIPKTRLCLHRAWGSDLSSEVYHLTTNLV